MVKKILKATDVEKLENTSFSIQNIAGLTVDGDPCTNMCSLRTCADCSLYTQCIACTCGTVGFGADAVCDACTAGNSACWECSCGTVALPRLTVAKLTE